MGWWKINSPECGGIDHENLPTGHDSDSKLLNAIPGRDSPEDHYNGDGPADTMQAAIGEIADQYREEWGRWPYYEELQAMFNFVTNKYKEDGQYSRSPPMTKDSDQGGGAS